MSNYSAIPDLNSRFAYWEEELETTGLKQRSIAVGYKCIITKIPKNYFHGGVRARDSRIRNWYKGLVELEKNRAEEQISKARKGARRYKQEEINELVKKYAGSNNITRKK